MLMDGRRGQAEGEALLEYFWMAFHEAPGIGASLQERPPELLLDEDVKVALLLKVAGGYLGVRAASPKDVRPSGSFDRPA